MAPRPNNTSSAGMVSNHMEVEEEPFLSSDSSTDEEVEQQPRRRLGRAAQAVGLLGTLAALVALALAAGGALPHATRASVTDSTVLEASGLKAAVKSITPASLRQPTLKKVVTDNQVDATPPESARSIKAVEELVATCKDDAECVCEKFGGFAGCAEALAADLKSGTKPRVIATKLLQGFYKDVQQPQLALRRIEEAASKNPTALKSLKALKESNALKEPTFSEALKESTISEARTIEETASKNSTALKSLKALAAWKALKESTVSKALKGVTSLGK